MLNMLRELLKSVEDELWIKSLDDVICVHVRRHEDSTTYYIYLKGGVEVVIDCVTDNCSVGFVGRRLIIENLDQLFDDVLYVKMVK